MVRDQTAYDFRFFDHAPELDARVHPRYFHPYPISKLAASSVQLRTLFGSARLHLKEDGNLAARTAIRKSMVFANTHLRTASVAGVSARRAGYVPRCPRAVAERPIPNDPETDGTFDLVSTGGLRLAQREWRRVEGRDVRVGASACTQPGCAASTTW